MLVTIAILAVVAALVVDWERVKCLVFGHSFLYSPPLETENGFVWTVTCTRCPEHGKLSINCGREKKDKLFVYCPATDHPMSPRYCAKSPHLRTCVECPYKGNVELTESAKHEVRSEVVLSGTER